MDMDTAIDIQLRNQAIENRLSMVRNAIDDAKRGIESVAKIHDCPELIHTWMFDLKDLLHEEAIKI